MCGKQASVPNCTPVIIFDARAVKQLAGSGSVYVCLSRDVCVSSSSSDDDLPKFKCLERTIEENLAFAKRGNRALLLLTVGIQCVHRISTDHLCRVLRGFTWIIKQREIY